MPPAVVMTAASYPAIECHALEAVERRRTRHFDHVGDACAVVLLDHPVELDERPTQMAGEHAAERGFAGAA